MNRSIPVLAAALVVATASSAAHALDVPIAADRLLIVDRIAASGNARVELLSHDPAIAKGPSTNVAEIDATVQVYTDDDPENYALFRAPPPWAKNEATAAKYVDDLAPSGGGVRLLVVKPGRVVKLYTRSAGDQHAIDLVASPPGAKGVTVLLTLHDASDDSTTRMCTHFAAADVVVKTIAEGTGRKLIAGNGQPVACKGGGTMLMQPDLPGGFFSMPWPNDIRHKGNGTLDLTGFPGTAGNPTLSSMLSIGSANTKAFGPNAAIFLRASAALDRASLPTAAESTSTASSILLVNLDAPADAPAPLLVDFNKSETTYRPANLLSVLPYPGHPLAEGARYALIVLDGVRDVRGLPLVPPPLLADLDQPWDSGKPVVKTKWEALQAQRADVLAYVAQHTAWQADQVVAFSVFTTQTTTSEMDAIAAAIAALPSPSPASRGTGDCSAPGAQRTTVTGLIGLPKWQSGTYPYASSGGRIVVNAGKAVQQGTEQVGFAMTFPCGAAPVSGWPLLLFMGDAGSSAQSDPIPELGAATLPFIVVSIAPLYGGDRAVAGSDPELLFINLENPLAGRTNQLQQAADVMFLRRAFLFTQLSAAETNAGVPVTADASKVVVVGHGQGARTIPLALSVDSAFGAAFLSAGGAGFYHQILHRADVRAVLDDILGTPADELDMFHPAVQLLQTFAEAGDAANFARRVGVADVAGTAGVADACEPLEQVQHLATALGAAITNPLAVPVFGAGAFEPTTVTRPVSANLAGGRTGVFVLLDAGHLGAGVNPQIGRGFVESFTTTGTPAVPAGTLSSDATAGCMGRYDPL